MAKTLFFFPEAAVVGSSLQSSRATRCWGGRTQKNLAAGGDGEAVAGYVRVRVCVSLSVCHFFFYFLISSSSCY